MTSENETINLSYESRGEDDLNSFHMSRICYDDDNYFVEKLWRNFYFTFLSRFGENDSTVLRGDAPLVRYYNNCFNNRSFRRNNSECVDVNLFIRSTSEEEQALSEKEIAALLSKSEFLKYYDGCDDFVLDETYRRQTLRFLKSSMGMYGFYRVELAGSREEPVGFLPDFMEYPVMVDYVVPGEWAEQQGMIIT